MRTCLFITLLCFSFYLSAQNSFYLITVKHIDQETGLPIRTASLKVEETNKTFKADKEGLIKLALPPGSYNFTTVSESHHAVSSPYTIKSDTIINIHLKSFFTTILIADIDVLDNYRTKQNMVETGVELLSMETIKELPAMAGERDLVKSLALLPGMQISSEGSSNLIVRGGNPDQNLFLLNGIQMFQTNHLFSVLSAVNPNFIDDVKVYKSGFPANYGGRVSSIIDMKTKNPDLNKKQVYGEIGIISTKLTYSMPVVKNKLAFMLGVRRTNLDFLTQPFKKKLRNATFNFYDLSFLANWKVNDSHNIKLFQNYSRDNFNIAPLTSNATIKTSEKNRWLNQISGFEWIAKENKFENHLKLGYSAYEMNKNYSVANDTLITENQKLTSIIKNIVIDNNTNFILTEYASINTGIQFEQYRLSPATCQWNFYQHKITQVRIAESALFSGFLYGSYIFKFKQFNGSLGFRGGAYKADEKNYISFEPRLNLKYDLPNHAIIKASYTKISQPLHLLSNNGLGMPVDLWIAANQTVKPIESNQFAIGFHKNLNIKDMNYELTCETYYKTTDNLVSYLDGYSSNYLTNIENTITPATLNEILAFGQGTAYGLELMLEKKEGNLTGWISYTLSKARNRFAEFEKGTPFNSPYDRPHNLSLVGSYPLKNNWTFNFTFSFLSGQPFTSPIMIYPKTDGLYSDYSVDLYTSKPNDFFNPSSVSPTGEYEPPHTKEPTYIYSERNAIRLKSFHKLDIGFKKQLKSRKNFSHWIELGAYNVYNRKNTAYGKLNYFPYFRKFSIVSVSLFPIIPSINYGFRF